MGNSLVRKSINVLFKNDIKDIMTGLRVFSFEFVKTFPVLSKGFEIETEMSIHAVEKICMLKTIVKLYRTYKPMGFFGAIAILLGIIALINFVPVMKIYLETGLVPKFPTLIVCGFMVVTAVQSFFAGLMLQTMMQKNRYV